MCKEVGDLLVPHENINFFHLIANTVLKQCYFAVNIFGQQDHGEALSEVSKEFSVPPAWIFRNSENPGEILEV